MIERWQAALIEDVPDDESRRWRRALPGHVPEPTINLMGCQAWSNVPHPPGKCPVCGPGIRPGDDTYHCLVCGSSSPRVEAKVRAARIGLKRRDKSEQAEKKARARLNRHPVVLTESERRRLWNGYRGGILSEFPELNNLARVGREWLIEQGQQPDWSLILDRRGNVIGRFVA